MKFRIIVSVLVIAMLGLFTMVIIQAINLRETNAELASLNESLENEKERVEQALEKNRNLELAKLQLENEDDLWDYTKKTNTLEAYTNYVKVKGNSRHADEINKKIDGFLSKKGYIQFVDSNGTKFLEPYTDIPNRKDLWVPKNARSVRRGVIGNPDYQPDTRTGDVLLEGQIVKMVGDYIYSGDSKWAEIAY